MPTGPLRHDRIEQQLVEALPELRTSADEYWRTEGPPGENCGPYVFFEDLFARYVEVLLALRASPRRDELLRRSFAFVEEMLASGDSDVSGLAWIGLFEGRSLRWLARAAPFLGPHAAAGLDENARGWRWKSTCLGWMEPRRKILDGHGIRALIAEELRAEGVTLSGVPGTSYTAKKSG